MVREIKREDTKNFLLKAEEFLSIANNAFNSNKFNAAAFNAIQAIINTNDALTVFTLGRRASTDHREAMSLHVEVIRKINVSSFRAILKEALNSRSEVGYSGKIVKKDEAEKFIRSAARFIEWVRNYVKW